MHEAGQRQPGGMAAILGLEEASLVEVCRETNTWIANVNCPGQLVISGATDNLSQAMTLAKAKGALRVLPLAVSGAFHSPLMQPAANGLSEVITALPFAAPKVPLIANATAQPLTTAELIKEELVRQLCNGIQWQRSVEAMINGDVSAFIEVGPGKVLTGLIKRISGDVKTVNIGDVEAIKGWRGEI